MKDKEILIHCANGYCDGIGNGCCFTESGNCEKEVEKKIINLEKEIDLLRQEPCDYTEQVIFTKLNIIKNLKNDLQ